MAAGKASSPDAIYQTVKQGLTSEQRAEFYHYLVVSVLADLHVGQRISRETFVKSLIDARAYVLANLGDA